MVMNLLLVDDSATTRKMLKKTIRLSGVPVGEVFEAGNGAEALEKMIQEDIDIVFADINMPVMDGIEMIRQMHEKHILALVPVVVISTEGSDSRIKELKDLGIRDYLRKPFTPEMVVQVFSRLSMELKNG